MEHPHTKEGFSPIRLVISAIDPEPWMEASKRDHFVIDTSSAGSAWDRVLDEIEKMPEVNSVAYHDHGGRYNRCCVSLKHPRDGQNTVTIRRTIAQRLAVTDSVEHVDF